MTYLVFFYVACFGAISVRLSPTMCLDDIKLGVGSCTATFYEKAPLSVNRTMYCVLLHIRLFLFWFRERDFGSDSSVTVHCLPSYF